MNDTVTNTSIAIRAGIAERFVDLALTRNKQEWLELKTCSEEETQIFFDAVSAAGFILKKVEPGKLFEHYRNDGLTDDAYLINQLCPIKVVDEASADYPFVAGWLDCAIRRVINGSSQQGESREELIEVIDYEIERSIPLEPIELTHEGDYLCERTPTELVFNLAYFVQHTRDWDDISMDAVNQYCGIHQYCGGLFARNRATKTHDVIVCRSCYLRVLFPKEVKTCGDLREKQGLYLSYHN